MPTKTAKKAVKKAVKKKAPAKAAKRPARKIPSKAPAPRPIYIVVGSGFWARGDSVADAAKKATKYPALGRKSDKVVLYFNLLPEGVSRTEANMPTVDGPMTIRASGHVVKVGYGLTLGQLEKLD